MSLFAQNNHNTTDEHEHDHHNNEIGIGYSPVYLTTDKEFVHSIHFHYLRNISETRFNIGLGYEKIFSDHNHDMVNLIGSIFLIDHLSFSIAPGLIFEDSKFDDIKFAMHFELYYEFELDNFHIGPMAGYSFSKEDNHIGVGIHLGYVF
jgi:hypothetical protein